MADQILTDAVTSRTLAFSRSHFSRLFTWPMQQNRRICDVRNEPKRRCAFVQSRGTYKSSILQPQIMKYSDRAKTSNSANPANPAMQTIQAIRAHFEAQFNNNPYFGLSSAQVTEVGGEFLNVTLANLTCLAQTP